jgi:hypothetical protein
MIEKNSSPFLIRRTNRSSNSGDKTQNTLTGEKNHSRNESFILIDTVPSDISKNEINSNTINSNKSSPVNNFFEALSNAANQTSKSLTNLFQKKNENTSKIISTKNNSKSNSKSNDTLNSDRTKPTNINTDEAKTIKSGQKKGLKSEKRHSYNDSNSKQDRPIENNNYFQMNEQESENLENPAVVVEEKEDVIIDERGNIRFCFLFK